MKRMPGLQRLALVPLAIIFLVSLLVSRKQSLQQDFRSMHSKNRSAVNVDDDNDDEQPRILLSHEAWQQLLDKFQYYITNPKLQDDLVLPLIIRQTEILCRQEHVNQFRYNLRFEMLAEMMHYAMNYSYEFRNVTLTESNKSKHDNESLMWRTNESNHPTLHLPLSPIDRSFPLIMRMGDGADCEGNIFPRFSWCTSGEGEHCHATAIPTFSLFRGMPHDSPEQESFHRELELHYPWSSKLRQAIWRGIPTGIAPNGWASLHRAKLVNFSIHHGDLFDGAFVELGQFQDWYPDEAPKLRKFSRFAKRIEMNDYQKYRAIVDIDGNSWSSRLGNLLCMNSVVIKVYPMHKNYFFEQLVPWKHFIPVKNDMSDLVEALRFAVSDEHELKVKDIIYQANEWCRTQLTKRQMTKDMFWMINDYVELLGDNATRWDQWNEQMAFYKGNVSLVAI